MKTAEFPSTRARFFDHGAARTVTPFVPAETNPPEPAREDEWDAAGSGAPAIRLGHVHLKVSELARAISFYTWILGLRVTERTGRCAFLAAGGEHHSLALEEIGAWTVVPSRRSVGVAHIAFEVADRSAFALTLQRLLKAGVPFVKRDNGISWTARFKDPDGNEIEIYLDRRDSVGGAKRWDGRWRVPFKMQEPAADAPGAPAAPAEAA